MTLAFWDSDFTNNNIYQKLLSEKLATDLGYVYENVVSQIVHPLWLSRLRLCESQCLYTQFRGSAGIAAAGAIAQIRQQNYPQLVSEFSGSILLVGISYGRKSKRHTCVIERIEKTQGVVKELSSQNSRSSQGVVKEYSWSVKQQAILDYCAEPRTLEEITLYLNVADRYYLKRKHINPMLDKSLFMTEPDTPTSPSQRYYTKK